MRPDNRGFVLPCQNWVPRIARLHADLVSA